LTGWLQLLGRLGLTACGAKTTRRVRADYYKRVHMVRQLLIIQRRRDQTFALRGAAQDPGRITNRGLTAEDVRTRMRARD